MSLAAAIGIGVIAAILASMLRRYHSEYASVLAIAAGAIIMLGILSGITPAVERLRSLLESVGLGSEYAGILLKSLGICFLAQFAADACRDAGESALASRVELVGKTAVVVLSLPLFEEIGSVALSLLGRGSG